MFSQIVNFKQMIYSRIISAILTAICLQCVCNFALIFLVNLCAWRPSNTDLFIYDIFHIQMWIIGSISSCLIGISIGKQQINSSYVQTNITNRFYTILKCFSINNSLIAILEVIFSYVLFEQFSIIFTNYPAISKHMKLEPQMFRFLTIWLSFYVIYSKNNHLNFPIINERPLRRFSKSFKSLILKSAKSSLLLATGYFLVYHLLHNKIIFVNDNGSYFHFISCNATKLMLISCFSGFYLVSRNLIDLVFEIFLTQHWVFSVIALETATVTDCGIPTDKQFISLSDAFKERFLSLVQQLACYDFYLMATFDHNRQMCLFQLAEMNAKVLRTWKIVVNDSLTILNEYTSTLNQLCDQLSPVIPNNNTSNSHNMNVNRLDAKDVSNLRNMSIKSAVNVDLIHLSTNNHSNGVKSMNELSSGNCDSVFWNAIHKVFYQNAWYKFLFDDRHLIKLQYLLDSNRPIIWLITGLVELMKSSLTNDKYGIAADDFERIITTLRDLEIQLERMNKLNSLRKFDAKYVNLKNELLATLRRNFYKINQTIAIHDLRYSISMSSTLFS